GFGSHHHAGVFDDPEHLINAVVDFAEQQARRLFAAADRGIAEGEFARGGDLDSHFVFDIGDVCAVALPGELTAVYVVMIFGDQEEAEPLRPRPAGALDVLRPGQYQVHDVFDHIVFGRGDEPFNAFDAPGAVVIAVCLSTAGTDIGTGVGFGQDHGG